MKNLAGKRSRVRSALVASAAACLTATAPVHAQETSSVTPGDSAASSTDEVVDSGDIIVTARRRQETLQSVPVIANVLGQAQIEQFQTRDIRDIAARIPGIQIGESSQANGTQVSIRGIGTTTFNPGIDQSVALSLDNLQLTQGLFYRSAFFDLAQIEVYKGPQALFYGKSSTGGVISIRSADPSDQVELIARAGYEVERNERQADLILSGPLSDTFGVRLAGEYGKTDGYFRNYAVAIPGLGGVTPPTRNAPGEYFVLRGTAVWKPSSTFDARLKINQTYDDQLRGSSVQYTSPGFSGPVPGLGIPFLSPLDDFRVDKKIYVVDLDPAAFQGLKNNGVPFTTTHLTFGSLELNYRPSEPLTLTSTTGYARVALDSLFNTVVTGAAGPIVAITQNFYRRDFTQELRLSSDYDTPLNFTVGGFVQRGRFSNVAALVGNRFLGLPAFLSNGVNRIKVTSNSVFGQLRYQIAPTVELAAGGRYTDERRVNRPFDFLTNTPVVTPRPKLRSKTFSPEVTLSYRPTDDLTLFAAGKRAYKSGSFDIVVPAAQGLDNAFGDERVTGGEAGVKSRLLDRRMSLNIAGYYYSYKGLQVGALDSNTAQFSSRTLNAGAARTYGIEGELTYRPDVPGLTLHAAANWNRGKFTKLQNVPCYGGQLISEGCNKLFSAAANLGAGGFTAQDRSGLPLVRSPEWQLEFGPSFETPVFGNTKLQLSSSTQYTSSYIANIPLAYRQGGFVKQDLAVTLRGPGEHWEVSVVGKNITDKVVTGNAGNSVSQTGLIPGFQNTGVASGRGPAGIDISSLYLEPGRSVWLRLTLRR